MMKVTLAIVAIFLAVASAQSISASFTYRGSADCSDTTKIVQVFVSTNGPCGTLGCDVSTNNAGFTTVTRCYNSYADIPLPSNVITLNSVFDAQCAIKNTGPIFAVPGIGGCTPVSDTVSQYYSVCNATMLGTMRCIGSSDCSSGCALDTEPLYPGKEGQCTSSGGNPPGTWFVCKADLTGTLPSATPTSATPTSASPVAGTPSPSSPVATPSTRPVATPTRTSSATQTAINVVGLLVSIIALVL